jgi:hypothetical protein
MTDGPLYVLYITPNNIFGRTIETLIIPEFLCSVNGQIARRKIMIEDKYVARFVMIDGRWYAIMRLFGKTHNSGILADVEYYKAFYLLGKGFEVDNNTGIIILSPEHIRFKTTWVILSTSSAPIVELVGGNDVYLPLVSSTVVDGYYNFDVLQSIRIDEIIRSASKLVHLNRPLNRL